jgi:hypothetical protein
MRRLWLVVPLFCSLITITAAGNLPARATPATPAGSPVASCPATTATENVTVARRWHEDVVSGH